LTAECLREVLDYNPGTGEFRWKTRAGGFQTVKTWNFRYANRPAGTLDTDGYVVIKVDRRTYKAHRLAHFWMTGEWPSLSIDHVDRNRADNRWDRLRSANNEEQRANNGLRQDNTSGFKGVSWSESKARWVAYITAGKKRRWLGNYDSPEAAFDARQAAAEKLHGDFANHARRAPEARAVA
jgi:hypothetical protein